MNLLFNNQIKKFLLLAVFLLTQSYLFAQTDKIIEVKIGDRKYQMGELFIITLKINDSTQITHIADTSVRRFKVPTVFLKDELKIEISKNLPDQDILCPDYSNNHDSFREYYLDKETLGSKELFKFNPYFNYSFNCKEFPSLGFNYNKADSVFLVKGTNYVLMTPVKWYCLATLFKNRETIHITSKSDIKEKNAILLAQKRAEIVKKNMINTGIIHSNFIVKPIDFNNPVLTEKEIEKIKDLKEKARGRRYNARVIVQ